MPKSKPIIAVDLDDVLAAEAEYIVDYSNKRWGYTLSLDDYQEDWLGMWQVPQEIGWPRVLELHKSGVVTQYRILEHAHEVLQKLKLRYRLMIVSSRLELVRDETTIWLEQNFADTFEAVHLTGFYDAGRQGAHLLTKAEVLQDLKVDYLIDDQPKHCFSAAEAGIQAVLFGDYAVGRGLHVPKGVVRCKDWRAVLEYFEGLR